MAEGDLSKVFGGGKASAAGAAEPELADIALDLGGDEAELDAEEAPPPDFALNAAEAFPELAGDDARIDALYRTIKSCHPGV